MLTVPAAHRRVRYRVCVLVLLIACASAGLFARGAAAEQASAPASPPAGLLDAGGLHSCAGLTGGSVRCWGRGASGQLGYATTSDVGDDETPSSAGPVSLGSGRTVKAITAGDFHTCALLEDQTVRCWGFGGDGRLGYGNTSNVADPSLVGPVNLGLGRTAKAISSGAAHTCAILDNGNVRCWGFGGGDRASDGRLGYGDTKSIGDDETPDTVDPVKLGAGRTAVAISAGGAHTCALLDDQNVRCWGRGAAGQLGYGITGTDRNTVGDKPTTTPDKFGPVNLGAGRTAKAISAGGVHTCALLDDDNIRCWGNSTAGRLGYGYVNTSQGIFPDNIGDVNNTPDQEGPVNLGPGRTAKAISAGDAHTCAVLDDGRVRCWGLAAGGRLGYPDLDSLGNQNNIGDDETPDSVDPVDIGTGRTATAISAGGEQTCARLDDAAVRCWGAGAFGRLGYCSQETIGDTETPGSVGPVNLEPGDNGTRCPGSTPIGPPVAPPGGDAGALPAPGGGAAPVTPGVDALRSGARPVNRLALALAAQAKRAQALRRCRAAAARRPKRLRRAAVRLCLKRYARTPGRVTKLTARGRGRTQIILTFTAPGSDGAKAPAARGYLIKQSRRPIRSARDFRRAQALCKGNCRFRANTVGAKNSLTVTRLRPRTTYYYAIAARDNVSGRLGARSQAVRASTGG